MRVAQRAPHPRRGAACAQDPRLGLEQHVVQIGRFERREQALGGDARLEALGWDTLVMHDPLGVGLPAPVLAHEPGHARLDVERRAGLGLDLAPELACPLRRTRMPGVGAVAGAHQARLVARRGALVPGGVGVDERDLPTRAGEPVRDRGPEYARTDHDC